MYIYIYIYVYIKAHFFKMKFFANNCHVEVIN